MSWAVEADQYENGWPCWCVTGPGDAEVNFSSEALALEYAAFKNDQAGRQTMNPYELIFCDQCGLSLAEHEYDRGRDHKPAYWQYGRGWICPTGEA